MSFPANEEATKAVMPGVGPFHDPAPRLASDDSDERLLATSSNVRSDPAQTDRWTNVRVVIPLVEAKVLGTTRTTRAAYRNGVEHFADHGTVGHVRAGDERGEWHTATVR